MPLIAFAWNRDVVIPTCFKWESSARFIHISGSPARLLTQSRRQADRIIRE
jgi:hypothetical protein